MQRNILIWALATFMAVGIACSKQRTSPDNNGRQVADQVSQSEKIQSNLDNGIEKNFKAALQSKGLARQPIRADANNGVLTLKGSVKSTKQKEEAQEIAQSIPNVGQVLNQIEIQR